VNLLLDTHTTLWWLGDNPTLSTKARSAIGNAGNLVFISAVVVWEITIKRAIGKLEVPDDFFEALDTQCFQQLDITAAHAIAIGELPDYHQDPFGRMLAAQAKVEGLTIVTRDQNLKKYDISFIVA